MTLTRKPLSSLSAILISVFAWLITFIATPIIFLISLCFLLPVSFVWDKKRHWIHQAAVLWGRIIMLGNPAWKIKLSGAENIQPGKCYVIVANHQSILDILIALAGMPLHFKFMAKHELFIIPFIGWHMKIAGYVPIDRGNVSSGKKAILEAREWLHQGVSVLFFPEGTRSMDGEIREFKMGAFKIAQEEGLEILPVVIDGTGDAVPKKSWKIKKKTDFVLAVQKPVAVSSGARAEDVCDRVQKIMIQKLSEIRKSMQ